MDRDFNDLHRRVWDAIDMLAEEKGLSPSGLAKAAGLDPTTFNPSKRVTRDGRLRWPGGETLARVMAASGTTMMDLAALTELRPRGYVDPERAVMRFDPARGGLIETEDRIDGTGMPPGCLPVSLDPIAPKTLAADLLRPGDIAVLRPLGLGSDKGRNGAIERYCVFGAEGAALSYHPPSDDAAALVMEVVALWF